MPLTRTVRDDGYDFEGFGESAPPAFFVCLPTREAFVFQALFQPVFHQRFYQRPTYRKEVPSPRSGYASTWPTVPSRLRPLPICVDAR